MHPRYQLPPFVALLVLGAALVLAGAPPAQAHRPIEVLLRLPPPQVPSAERLDLAQRLYEMDRLDDAGHWARSILNDNAPETPEALLLLGRIAFTRGDLSGARSHFNRIHAHHPHSRPLTSGALARHAFRAMEILLQEYQYGQCGGFIDLLKQIDPHAVQSIAHRLEKLLDQELEALQRQLAGQRRHAGRALIRAVAQDFWKDARFHVASCRRLDHACHSDAARRADDRLAAMRRTDQRRWDDGLGPWYRGARAAFASGAMETALQYTLIPRLLDDAILIEAIAPANPPAITMPVTHALVTESTTLRRQNALKELLEGTNNQGTAYRVQRRADPAAVEAAFDAQMGFGPLNRARLLENLGKLLYSGGAAVRPQHKL